MSDKIKGKGDMEYNSMVSEGQAIIVGRKHVCDGTADKRAP